MDENTTSWKSHSFTLMIFAGIVVLSSIFFVLGMLVGRNQGQHAAELAADQSSRKPGAESGTEDFPLTFYDQSTEEKPDNKLQPVPAASAQPVAPAPPALTASKNAPSPVPPESKNDKKSAAPPKPASPPGKPAEAKQATPKASPDVNVYLQIASVKTEKQGTTELKKVQSKGFKATMRPVKVSGEMVYRILVGPYKESEVKNARAALLAKGYKDPVLRK
jgi:cell division septation protein DedD